MRKVDIQFYNFRSEESQQDNNRDHHHRGRNHTSAVTSGGGGDHGGGVVRGRTEVTPPFLSPWLPPMEIWPPLLMRRKT